MMRDGECKKMCGSREREQQREYGSGREREREHAQAVGRIFHVIDNDNALTNPVMN